jgi:WD40 repeat protein
MFSCCLVVFWFLQIILVCPQDIPFISGYLLCCFHAHPVSAATFDRTGRYVITGSDDRLVKIWAIETAFCLASCRGHEVSFAYCFILVFTTLRV